MIKQLNGYDKAAGIYQLVNKINGKIYIGATSNFKERSMTHQRAFKKNNHDNKQLQNDWNQYGSDVFVFGVLEVVQNPEERLKAEKNWIEMLYGNNCYNELIGRTHSDVTKQKLREAKLGKTHSEAAKQKMSETRRGKKGQPKSEATKQKISQARLGKCFSEATKQKMRESQQRRRAEDKSKHTL